MINFIIYFHLIKMECRKWTLFLNIVVMKIGMGAQGSVEDILTGYDRVSDGWQEYRRILLGHVGTGHEIRVVILKCILNYIGNFGNFGNLIRDSLWSLRYELWSLRCELWSLRNKISPKPQYPNII